MDNPADLHAAAVEAADDALQRLLISSKHFPQKGDLAAVAIRAYLAHLAVAGWKITPREATEEMRRHANDLTCDDEGWPWMHDAAPAWPP